MPDCLNNYIRLRKRTFYTDLSCSRYSLLSLHFNRSSKSVQAFHVSWTKIKLQTSKCCMWVKLMMHGGNSQLYYPVLVDNFYIRKLDIIPQHEKKSFVFLIANDVKLLITTLSIYAIESCFPYLLSFERST